jgi:hypothetical protein
MGEEPAAFTIRVEVCARLHSILFWKTIIFIVVATRTLKSRMINGILDVNMYVKFHDILECDLDMSLILSFVFTLP